MRAVAFGTPVTVGPKAVARLLCPQTRKDKSLVTALALAWLEAAGVQNRCCRFFYKYATLSGLIPFS